MNVPENQVDFVRQYFLIRIWAAPATFASYAILGWFFGLQNAVFPLFITLVVNLFNIVVSYLLVFHYQYEIDGVAWGTVAAQYLGFLLGVGLILYKYRDTIKELIPSEIFEATPLLGFLKVNSDIFIRTVCLTLVFGFFYSQSAKEGAMILAVNVILLQYLNWMSYGVDGFAYATESMVGKYFGAKNNKMARKTISYNFYWGFVLATIYALVYGVWGDNLLYLFTNQADVINSAQPYLWWLILLPFIGTPSYIWDGVFVGLTAAKSMRNSMLLSFVVFAAAFFILSGTLGNHALWAALLLFLGARGLIQWYLYKRYDLNLQ
jgi:MATE family multidrug resistance protein